MNSTLHACLQIASHSSEKLENSVREQGTAPRILVIIPCFNDRKIDRCLESIRVYTNQERTQVLVVDDGSDPGFLEFLFGLKIIHKFELACNQVNHGPAFSRNVGLAYAAEQEFEYVTFVDSDDQLIGVLEPVDYEHNDLTVFNSIEFDQYLPEVGPIGGDRLLFSWQKDAAHFTINNCAYDCIESTIEAYLERPNRVPTLTACWGKVYRLPLVTKSRLLFNTKMKTFEDVDFVVNFLKVSGSLSFNEKILYAHTRYKGIVGATFGTDFNSLFSFLQMSRNLAAFIKIKKISPKTSIHHFRAAYYSISLVRASAKIKTIREFLEFISFARRRIRSPVMRRSFDNYNASRAGGREVFRILVLNNLAVLLAIIALYFGKKRYGNLRR